MEGLMGIFVFHTNDDGSFNLAKIAINDTDLEELEDDIIIKSGDSLKNLDQESLENQKGYRLLDNEKHRYQMVKMNDLYNKMVETDDTIPYLEKFSDLYIRESKDMVYDGLFYFSENEVGGFIQKQLSVFNLKKTNILGNKEVAFFKRKKVSATNKQMYTELASIDDGMSLPLENCVATYHLRENQKNHQVIVTANIFNALIFDDIFNDATMKEKYAGNVLTKFENGTMRLTSNELEVKVPDKNSVLSALKEDTKLLNAFAGFHGTKRSTIQKVSKTELTAVLNRLSDYIENNEGNAEVTLTTMNIPEVKDENIVLTEESVKIFAALLENKVIEKLLTHEITIPYL